MRRDGGQGETPQHPSFHFRQRPMPERAGSSYGRSRSKLPPASFSQVRQDHLPLHDAGNTFGQNATNLDSAKWHVGKNSGLEVQHGSISAAKARFLKSGAGTSLGVSR